MKLRELLAAKAGVVGGVVFAEKQKNLEPLPSQPPALSPPDMRLNPEGGVTAQPAPSLLKANDCTPERPISVSSGPLMPVIARVKLSMVEVTTVSVRV